MSLPDAKVLGLLHTSPVHVATFDALGSAEAPDVRLVHVVRPDLLERARAEAPASVLVDVARALAEIEADVVLCTCSTIGAIAERVSAEQVGGPRTLRVDRPMAAAAVAAGGPIVVLAALESTLEPTRVLLLDEADRAGTTPEIEVRLVAGAWDRFESGDLAGYHRVVAEAVRQAAPDAAVVVLAQASMAPAAGLAHVDVTVLSSPRLGLQAAVRLATS